MKPSKPFLFQFVHVIFWIIFVGLCIKIGAIGYSFFVSIMSNPLAAQDLYEGLNLSSLYTYNPLQYSCIVIAYIILSLFLARMSFYVLQIFAHIDLLAPFSDTINVYIKKIASLGLITGIWATLAFSYAHWITKNTDIHIPIQWGHEEILFFAAVVALLSLIFDRGITLQKENDLTI